MNITTLYPPLQPATAELPLNLANGWAPEKMNEAGGFPSTHIDEALDLNPPASLNGSDQNGASE